MDSCFSKIAVKRKDAAEMLSVDVKEIDRLEREGALTRSKWFSRPLYPVSQIIAIVDPKNTKSLREMALEKELERERKEKHALMDALLKLGWTP